MELFVLFADMLGFEQLVENDDEQLEDFNPILKGINLASPSQSANLLRERFVNFHRCLHTQRETILQARIGTSIVFSDSAFFCVPRLDQCLGMARDLMRALITCAVPARMGIGHGSFRSLRFMSDISDSVRLHESQFLGTGITRAHGAEQCGAKGLRILLHPSLAPYLTGPVKLGVVEASVPLPNKRGVVLELNYAYRDDEDCDSDAGPDVPDHSLATQVRFMYILADDSQHEHYEATMDALNRMRVQYGREPFARTFLH